MARHRWNEKLICSVCGLRKSPQNYYDHNNNPFYKAFYYKDNVKIDYIPCISKKT